MNDNWFSYIFKTFEGISGKESSERYGSSHKKYLLSKYLKSAWR